MHHTHTHLQPVALPNGELRELEELRLGGDAGALNQLTHCFAENVDALVGMPLIGTNFHQCRVQVVHLAMDLCSQCERG